MRSKYTTIVLALTVLIITITACGGKAIEQEESKKLTAEMKTVRTEEPKDDGRLPGDDIPATEYAVMQEPSIEDAWGEAAAYIAKTIYGEALVCGTTERAAVAWCVLNRTDCDWYPDDIIGVVTQKSQFHGYDEENPVLPELYDLALDVIERWLQEKSGAADAGRVLPEEYLFFGGDGTHNYFRTKWDGGTVWDWSLPSPYEE